MSRLLKLALLIYGIVTFVFGAPLLLAPGRFLDFFGWAPVDPLLSRLLGAALLGMTWSALRAWREAEPRRSIVTYRRTSSALSRPTRNYRRRRSGWSSRSGWPPSDRCPRRCRMRCGTR